MTVPSGISATVSAELASVIDGLFALGPAEYHGALAGALCRARPAAVDPLALFALHHDQPQARDRAALEALRDVLHQQLATSDGTFAPLLPDDEAPLKERAQALGEWCEGFLYGLAQGGVLDLKAASEDLREVVSDLTQFTRAAFDDGGDQEIEETAYAELVEYVRVGAQLVFIELSPRQQATRH
jgi:uncharacterized protein